MLSLSTFFYVFSPESRVFCDDDVVFYNILAERSLGAVDAPPAAGASLDAVGGLDADRVLSALVSCAGRGRQRAFFDARDQRARRDATGDAGIRGQEGQSIRELRRSSCVT